VKQWSEKLWNCSRSMCSKWKKSHWNNSLQSFKNNYWFEVCLKEHVTCVHKEIYEELNSALKKAQGEKNEKELGKEKKLQTKCRSKEGKKKEEAERTWKQRLHLTKEEREKLNQWIGIYRWVYNQRVNEYKQGTGKFVKNESLNEKEWVLELPWDSKDGAVDEFLTAFRSNKNVYKERLANEREKLRKIGLKGKALQTALHQNVKPFEIIFKSKRRKDKNPSLFDIKTGIIKMENPHG